VKFFYIVPRVVRHFLPERVTRFLLMRNWIIQASLETNDSQFAVKRYANALETHGQTIKGKRVMVFGYGGRFDIGIALLEAGADYVALCDKYAQPDERHNRALLDKYPTYLRLERSWRSSKSVFFRPYRDPAITRIILSYPSCYHLMKRSAFPTKTLTLPSPNGRGETVPTKGHVNRGEGWFEIKVAT